MPSTAELPRFAVYTATDHRAPIWIVGWLSLIYSVLFLIVRLAIKQKFFGLDDAALALGYVVSFGQWAVLFRSLVVGAGKATDALHPPHVATAAELVFTSRILTLVGLGLSKVSVALFLRMLFTRENRKAWTACTVLIGLTGLWTVAAPIIVSAGCSATHAINPDSSAKCPGDLARWQAVTVVDIVLEAVGIALPAYLFSGVRMKVTRKLTVVAAFVFRLTVIAFFIAYIVTFTAFRNGSRVSIGAVSPLIWQQLLLASALMTATIPCLKGFLGRFKTGDLARLTEYSDSFGSHTGTVGTRNNTAHNQSFALSTLNGRGTHRGNKISDDLDELPIRPGGGEHTATAYADPHDGASGSVKSFGSEQMIIHRKVEWDVVPQ